MKTTNQPNLISKKSPFLRAQLAFMAMAVAVGGYYVVNKAFAAGESVSLIPSATAVNLGDNVTIAVRENSTTQGVNAVGAEITFDSTKLQYVSVSETGSAFGLVAETTLATGKLTLVRATSGGAAPLTGDQLVTTVTFKALAAGSVPLALGTGSVLLRSSDNTDILAVKNGTTLTLADTGAPTVPVGLTAPTRNMTSLTISWTTATDNVAVTGYRVFRNDVSIGTPTTTTFTDSGLNPNTTYAYKVAAFDAAGNQSAASTVLNATTLADTQAPSVPGKPTSPSQTMTSVNLSWTAATDNVAVTGYRVYRNGTQVAIQSTPSYSDTGLTVNTSYSYTVSAVDAAGNTSAQSAATAVSTLPDTQTPTVPTNVQAIVTGLNIALSWTASTDNVAVTSYKIYRDGTQVGTATTTSANLTSVPTGTHNYTVVAADAAGNVSAASIAVSVQVYVQGDVNNNGTVDIFDLSQLLTNWGRTGTNSSDVNGDNTVNIFDLSILLSHWTG